jgi:hypothetical protein
MANSTVASGNIHTRHLAQVFREYVRDNRFSRYMGSTANSIIHTKEERVTGRQKISIPLVTRLKGAASVGSTTLRGNGEAIGNYAWELTPTYRRHAVEFDKEELDKPNFDMFAESRPLLMTWAMEDLRDQVIDAMFAVYNGSTYSEVDSTTAAVRNTWNANNSDRVLYGAATSNYNATFATALGNIDSTADKLDRDIVSLLATRAKEADPHIRPIRVTEDEEYFVLFVGSRSMRHLRTDLETLHSNAMPRSATGNPLWKAGDLMWENVIIREVPEITTQYTDNSSSLFNDAGDSSEKVEPIVLCGAQALGWAIGKRPGIIIDRDYDFEFQPGIAVEKKEDVRKMFFDDIQHGVVSGFVSGEV